MNSTKISIGKEQMTSDKELITFNLIDRPWIPVIDIHGNQLTVSLKELYEQADTLVDFVLNVPQQIAVVRLLLCISQAALQGPTNREDWLSSRERLIPESLAYLVKWHDRFDLFGNPPFLQVAGLQVTELKTDKQSASEKNDADIGNSKVDKLDITLASGNNKTVFDNTAVPEGRIHSAERIALHLLAGLLFSPSGRISIATIGENPTPGNGSSTATPCLEGSMLFTILFGSNLTETLWLNMVPTVTEELGQPAWEDSLDKLFSDKPAASQNKYLHRLIPVGRSIRLIPNCRDMIYGNGFTYDGFPAYREPMATVLTDTKKKTECYLRTNPQQHPWRNLASILVNEKRLEHRNCPQPLQNLRDFAQLAVDNNSVYRLWTGGVVADKAKIIDATSWSIAIETRALGSNALELYEEGVSYASNTVSRVRDAVNVFLNNLSLRQEAKKTSHLASIAALQFWSSLDTCYEILQTSAIKGSLDQWIELVQKTAFNTYERTCTHSTPRTLKAFVAGKEKLFTRSQKRNVFSKGSEKQQ